MLEDAAIWTVERDVGVAARGLVWTGTIVHEEPEEVEMAI